MQNSVVTTFPPGKSPLIKGIMPGLPERGKIKIGQKGRLIRDSFRMPEKLDHFVITKLTRGEDDNFEPDTELMSSILRSQGLPPDAKLTRIPITLIYDDIALNFQSRYTAFIGRTRWCSGDGEAAFRLNDKGEHDQIACPCPRADPKFTGDDGKGKGKCKITGCLQCIIREANTVGGVWKFRTTSFNSVQAITSTLFYIKSITGGPLHGIPLDLVVAPRTAMNPMDQKPVTIHVVSVEFAGSFSQLRETGVKLALESAQQHLRIEHIEDQARRLLSIDAAVIEDEDEHADEFHPLDAAGTAEVTMTVPTIETPAADAPVVPLPSLPVAQAAESAPASAQAIAPAPQTRRGRPRSQAPAQPAQAPTESALTAEAAPVAPTVAAPVAPAPAPATVVNSITPPAGTEAVTAPSFFD